MVRVVIPRLYYSLRNSKDLVGQRGQDRTEQRGRNCSGEASLGPVDDYGGRGRDAISKSGVLVCRNGSSHWSGRRLQPDTGDNGPRTRLTGTRA